MHKEIIIRQIAASHYIAKFRDVNKFIECCKQCTCYNTTWSCPSFATITGNYIDAKNQKIEDFSVATIIGVKINIDKKLRVSPRSEEERDNLTRDILSEVRREFDDKLLQFEQKIQPSMLYYAGTCIICATSECARLKDIPCYYPEKMRSTLEADGFDIGRTCSDLLGIDILWCDGFELPKYYTLVYGFISNQSVEDKLRSILNGDAVS